MAWKSILTIWDGREATRPAFDAAMRLANDGDAHLDVLCIGLDRTPTGYYSDAAISVLDSFQRAAIAEAEARAAEARAALAGAMFAHSVRTAAVRYAEIGEAVGRAAWTEDLAVLAKPFGADGDEAPELFLEAALFDSTTPALVVPESGDGRQPRRVLIGWNGSREAMRAVRAALPVLAKAEAVTVAIVDPGRLETEEEDPGRTFAAWLARHGLAVEIAAVAETGASVAHTLNRAAQERGCEMIVMGAYGHSRFREMLLGGATRDMLKSAEVPVLMAH